MLTPREIVAVTITSRHISPSNVYGPDFSAKSGRSVSERQPTSPPLTSSADRLFHPGNELHKLPPSGLARNRESADDIRAADSIGLSCQCDDYARLGPGICACSPSSRSGSDLDELGARSPRSSARITLSAKITAPGALNLGRLRSDAASRPGPVARARPDPVFGEAHGVHRLRAD
jgi:hypothetical protein